MAEDENNPQAAAPAADGADQPQGPQFALQRIYLKDSSFESPRSPVVFQGQWSPKINFDIKTRSSKVQDDIYEVILVLTAEAQMEEQAAFLVEVHQAGLFLCKDFDEAQLEQLLATMCPNILFPYAREAIDGLVIKGSFPALMLSPINFDALYAQQKQAQEQQAAEGGAADEEPPAAETVQ
ncbi:MAG: protein-export chaperone SecB [Gammaproteobacteria bacterium]|jgi:preprotein translocase subunit SecB|nr:protein-export chaperone SecB [Gammaproteobacteria bacterium]HJN94439.1 protein-export chaperone SecB [Gammaproteobacteria bacterium]|tara:strand:- start:11437 stop:11979 length:543 start_codon:yes stop_codon:yes gene_type:complete